MSHLVTKINKLFQSSTPRIVHATQKSNGQPRAATGRGPPKNLGDGGALGVIWGRSACEMDTTVDRGEIDPLTDPDIVFDSVSYEAQ